MVVFPTSWISDEIDLHFWFVYIILILRRRISNTSVCGLEHIYVSALTHMETRGDSLYYYSPLYFLRQGLSLNLRLIFLLN